MGLDDAAEAVADLALRHASTGSYQLATDLATLATALGHEQVELLAYVATATPTRQLPTRTPTATPTATPTRQPPTHTPTATPTATPTRQPPTPTRRPPTRQPPTATALPAAATPLPLEWDRCVDMLSPPVKVLGADVALGQRYWRLVRLEWWKQSEGGNATLYVSTLNENGQPVWGQEVIIENGGHTILYTNPKPGEPYGVNFRMDGALNSYHVFVGGDLPSERVVGLGLGETPGIKEHTTFVLAFQRSKK